MDLRVRGVPFSTQFELPLGNGNYRSRWSLANTFAQIRTIAK